MCFKADIPSMDLYIFLIWVLTVKCLAEIEISFLLTEISSFGFLLVSYATFSVTLQSMADI